MPVAVGFWAEPGHDERGSGLPIADNGRIRRRPPPGLVDDYLEGSSEGIVNNVFVNHI